MLYRVLGKDQQDKFYSIDINVKTPHQANKLAVGNIIKEVIKIMTIKNDIPLKVWETKDNKLIRIQ